MRIIPFLESVFFSITNCISPSFVDKYKRSSFVLLATVPVTVPVAALRFTESADAGVSDVSTEDTVAAPSEMLIACM